jgi:hypothetical protein
MLPWLKTPYRPTDSFNEVFGRDAFSGDPMLIQVLWFGGGGLDALGRQAVAALLNAAHPYTFPPPAIDTPAEVIAAFQAAFDSGDYETTKNMFKDANEAGCPMDACGKHK